MITDEELDEEERIANAATPGPWRWRDWNVEFGKREDPNYRRWLNGNDQRPDEPQIATREDDRPLVLAAEDPVGMGISEEDARFLARSRTTVPRLIAALREERKHGREWEQQLEAATGRAATHVAELLEKNRKLEQERDAFREAVVDLLKSAVPNQRDHPTMFAAWKKANGVLESIPAPGSAALVALVSLSQALQSCSGPRAAALVGLISRCPLGYSNGKLISHRSTTDEDVIAWLEELKQLAKDYER